MEVVEQDSEFPMGRLDVDSLFTNIPLEEAIDICTNKLFENSENVALSIIELKELSSLATKEPCYNFNGKLLYKQVDGVAMGLPLGPTLVNVFLLLFEENWLQNCPSDLKPHYCRR